MEELIISKARQLFFTYGLKSVSMDDLAKEAGVSKKTIYQYVSDKAELVTKVAKQFMDCHKAETVQSYNLATNAVEEVVLQAKVSLAQLAPIKYSFFHDMEKAFPDAWQMLLQHRREHLLGSITQNLKRGINEGLYRTGLDLELTPHIRLQQLQLVVLPGAFTPFHLTMEQLMMRLTSFYLHGITNSNGSHMIPEYLKEPIINKQK